MIEEKGTGKMVELYFNFKKFLKLLIKMKNGQEKILFLEIKLGYVVHL